MSLEAYHLPLGPELRSLADIGGFLDSPAARDTILSNQAYDVARNIYSYMHYGQEDYVPPAEAAISHPLEAADFERLFDPTLPTIVLDCSHAFVGNELILLAAAERKAQGEAQVNVLCVPTVTDSARIVTLPDGQSALVATHGVLIDENGHAFSGQLPFPVRADLVECPNRLLMRQCRDNGIPTVTAPQSIKKSDLPAIAKASGVATPEPFAIDALWLADEHAEYVIKPNDNFGGRGVRMFSGIGDQPAAQAYFAFLQAHGYEPLVEQRITPTPLYIDRNGEQMPADWNARVLMFGGKVINMYIRADTPGGAINADQGAAEFLIDELNALTGSAERGELILQTLLQSSHRIAQAVAEDYGLTGGDLTVDGATLDTVMFEMNDGNVGGPRAIARFEAQHAHKLLDCNYLLNAWAAGLTRGEPVTDVDMSSAERMERDITAYSYGLWSTDRPEALGAVSETEIAALASNHWDYKNWLASRYILASKLYPQTAAVAAAQAVDLDFLRLAPLEFGTALSQIAYVRPDSHQLLAYADQFQAITPTDHYWNCVRIGANSQLGRMDAMRAIGVELLSRGANSEELLDLLSAITATTLQSKLGLDAASNYSQVAGIWRDYLEVGYQAAIDRIDMLVEYTADPEPDDVSCLKILGLTLSINHGDMSQALQYARSLDPIYVGCVAGDVAGSSEESTQLVAALAVLADNGTPLSALHIYLNRAQVFAGEASQEATDMLARLMATALQQEDRASIGKLSAFLRAAAIDPANTSALTEGTLAYATQAALTLARARHYDIYTLMQGIDGNPHISDLDQFNIIEELHALFDAQANES